MRTDSPPSRSGTLGAGATALMTLVAIAATVSAAPPAAQLGCTAAIMEQSGVRGVAAVVAAAAREFLGGGEQHTADTPQPHAPRITSVPQVIQQHTTAAIAPRRMLAEHLLNLPPPVC